MPRVMIDATDARSAKPRGWARYLIELLRAFRAGAAPDLEIVEGAGWGRVPEVVRQQIGLPLSSGGAAVIHAPNCFLPARRPCPVRVTIHDRAMQTHPDDYGAR